MRTCYLHAGMPKTGSTSIQNAFHGYASDTLRYADLGHSNHGTPLVSCFAAKPEKFYIFRNRQYSAARVAEEVTKHRSRLEREVKKPGDLILSSEAIVDHLNAEEIGAMADFLRGHFDRVQVIIYVRPLASLAASQMQERIKAGQMKFFVPDPTYKRRFQAFIEHFGRDSITFVRFTREDLVGGSPVSDFCSRVGAKDLAKDDVSQNEALSAEALGALYAFNKFVGPHLPMRSKVEMRTALKTRLRNVKGTKFALTEDLVNAHIKKHAADVLWAEETCGFDVRGRTVSAADAIGSEADLLAAAARAKPSRKR
ncbi:hypothetical protein [Falsirhodobacter algicola]|uniref:Sulfotransferase family protein n=1 Tax=Falsirhodobacter algicola TaxID=2692330 RepID=A0A8J8SKG4_9RHOB|nr:hypothetical protein [Falsirhodobacter algicola]QUS35875.1 hypothetical protein GR316_06130 [Falsirhodobacter algicola]